MHCTSKVNLAQRPTNLLTVLMLTNYGLNANYDYLTMRKLENRNLVKKCSRIHPDETYIEDRLKKQPEGVFGS